MLVMNKQEIIRFREDSLIMIKNTKGQVFIPLKQLCYYLGVPWEPQRKRINRDPVLKSVTFYSFGIKAGCQEGR